MERLSDEELRQRVKQLEDGLQAFLLGWVEASGREIEHITVDTRQFANLKVEVFLKR